MKRLTVSLLFAVLCVTAQVATVPNTDHATLRTNLNNRLQDAASISGSYSNPSWITSMAFAKLSGVPAFARTDQGNTWTTGAQDFSAATHLRVPNAAGYTPALNGHFGYDSTANAFKGYVGASVKTFSFLDSNITGTAAGLSGTPALPNGTTATTQTVGDTTTKVATTAFVIANAGSLTDFVTTKTSGSVITVSGGTFRYGTNVIHLSGPLTFTLQTVAISSITTSSTQTHIVTASPMANVVDGQAINVQLTGTGPGCAAGTGVFVATRDTSTSFWIAADTSAGCTGVSGTVGAQTGGTAIIFGNSAGQIEMAHSAAMGALVSASGIGVVANQTATGIFPNGSVPIAYATVSAGAFDTVTDYRAVLSNMQVQSGPGIDVTMLGGQAQVSVASNVPLVDQPSNWLNSVIMKDATKTLPWRTGTVSPNGRDNCANKGEAYFQTDTIALWVCTATGTPGTWALAGGSTLPNVTNDVQTKAAIVPNTVPSAGQILAGTAGGTAYAPVTISQDCTVASTGAITCTKTNNVAFGTGATANISNYAPLVSPSFTTPALGVATTTSINGTIIPSGKTLMATDTAIADAQMNGKYKTWSQNITLFDPVIGDSGRVQFRLPFAGTVTSVSCAVKTAASAVPINLEVRAVATPDTAGTVVLTTNLACDPDSQATTTFSNAVIAADVPVAITIPASLTGTPDTLRIYIKGTIN